MVELNNTKENQFATKVHKEEIDFLLNEIKQRKTITIDNLLIKLKEKYPHASYVHQCSKKWIN
jgi:hypothetical protein